MSADVKEEVCIREEIKVEESEILENVEKHENTFETSRKFVFLDADNIEINTNLYSPTSRSLNKTEIFKRKIRAVQESIMKSAFLVKEQQTVVDPSGSGEFKIKILKPWEINHNYKEGKVGQVERTSGERMNKPKISPARILSNEVRKHSSEVKTGIPTCLYCGRIDKNPEDHKKHVKNEPEISPAKILTNEVETEIPSCLYCRNIKSTVQNPIDHKKPIVGGTKPKIQKITNEVKKISAGVKIGLPTCLYCGRIDKDPEDHKKHVESHKQEKHVPKVYSKNMKVKTATGEEVVYRCFIRDVKNGKDFIAHLQTHVNERKKDFRLRKTHNKNWRKHLKCESIKVKRKLRQQDESSENSNSNNTSLEKN